MASGQTNADAWNAYGAILENRVHPTGPPGSALRARGTPRDSLHLEATFEQLLEGGISIYLCLDPTTLTGRPKFLYGQSLFRYKPNALIVDVSIPVGRCTTAESIPKVDLALSAGGRPFEYADPGIHSHIDDPGTRAHTGFDFSDLWKCEWELGDNDSYYCVYHLDFAESLYGQQGVAMPLAEENIIHPEGSDKSIHLWPTTLQITILTHTRGYLTVNLCIVEPNADRAASAVAPVLYQMDYIATSGTFCRKFETGNSVAWSKLQKHCIDLRQVVVTDETRARAKERNRWVWPWTQRQLRGFLNQTSLEGLESESRTGGFSSTE